MYSLQTKISFRIERGSRLTTKSEKVYSWNSTKIDIQKVKKGRCSIISELEFKFIHVEAWIKRRNKISIFKKREFSRILVFCSQTLDPKVLNVPFWCSIFIHRAIILTIFSMSTQCQYARNSQFWWIFRGFLIFFHCRSKKFSFVHFQFGNQFYKLF